MRQVAIVRHGSPERGLLVRQVPVPEPGAGQVRIEAEAIGVNFSDTLARRGLVPGAPPLPYVPGFEAAGRVTATGLGVEAFRPGDPVFCLLLSGGYSEQVVAPAAATYHRPEDLSAEVAAALPVQGLTAWYALFESGTVRPGDRVLIHAAAGGVGLLAVQLALHAGATVFGTAGSDAKVERLRAAGVHHPLNYARHDYEEEVRRLTGGEGVDIVLDSLGGSHIGKAFRILRPGGRVASYGYAAQSGGLLRMYLGFLAMKTLRTAYLLRDSQAFHGINLRMLARFPDRLKLRVDDVLRAWKDGVLRPEIGARFPLEEAAAAHAALENRKTAGKVLLIPGASA